MVKLLAIAYMFQHHWLDLKNGHIDYVESVTDGMIDKTTVNDMSLHTDNKHTQYMCYHPGKFAFDSVVDICAVMFDSITTNDCIITSHH